MEASSSIVFSERGVRKGPWCEEEDLLLRKCIEKYGEGKWGQVPLKAGLNRCRKSCRLRWCNYLKPNIKRGEFEADELDLIMRMHKLLGNRWSIIAGRLPGRTANDVKNYYNTRLKKKCFFQSNAEAEQVVIVNKLGGQTNNDHNHCRRVQKGKQPCTNMSTAADDCNSYRMRTKVLKPLPRSFTCKSQMITNKASSSTGMNNGNGALGTRISDINDKESVTNDMTILAPKKPKKKKKSEKKKNKGITTRSAVVDFENLTSSLGAEKGMKFTVGDKIEDQHVFYRNFNGDQRADEGGNDDYWSDLYFDYNSWGALGEEQDLIF